MHYLNISFPDNLLAIFDSIPELTFGIVWVFSRKPDSFWLGELLLAMLGKEVIFDINEFALFVYPIYIDQLTKLAAKSKVVGPTI